MSLVNEACVATIGAINAGLKDQANLVRLQIMEEVMVEDPYTNLFEGGTVAAHEGETITTQLAGRPVLNKSMTAPVFVAKSTLCNLQGEKAAFGSEQFTAVLGGDRGESPYLCVHDNFTKLDRELEQHVNGLKRMVKEYVMADARYNLLVNSGHKYVATTGTSVAGRLTGGEFQIAVDFNGQLPNATITHREVVRICKTVGTNSRLTKFGFGAGIHAKLIVSEELEDKLRNEANLHAEQVALVQGSDAKSIEQMKAYSWAKYPYRGIEIGIDPIPLRFNQVDGNGFPILIAPYEVQVGNEGQHWVTNSEWIEAACEVGFIAFKNSFKRLVPENFTSDGAGTSWPAISAMGSLEWLNVRDMTCNKYGDRGQFIWEVIRAWQPVQAWAVVPFLSKRCAPVDDLIACPGDSISES